MNKFLAMLLVCALAESAFALPVSHKDTRQLLNSASPNSLRTTQLGSQVTNSKVHLLRATYRYSAQGGSSSTSPISLRDFDGKPAKLPSGAIIKQVAILTNTQPVSTVSGANSATLAFRAQSAADLKAATSALTYTAGIAAGIPIGTAATMLKLTAERTIQLTLGVADLSAGSIDLLIEYYLTD